MPLKNDYSDAAASLDVITADWLNAVAKLLEAHVAVDVTGSDDVTLLEAEYTARVVKLTGTLTGSIDVFVPAETRAYLVHNATSGAHTVTVKPSGANGIVVPQGTAMLLYCDGTDVLAGSPPVVPATGALPANYRTHVSVVAIENLAAGDDIAARAVFAAPAMGCTLSKTGIVPLGASAGIDNGNTAVLTLADGAANVIVSKTYNAGTQPPAANVYGDLGALNETHRVLTANEVVTLAVTQGPTADLPAFLLVIEWLAPAP